MILNLNLAPAIQCTSKFSETAVLRPSINIADVLNLVLIVNLVSIVV